MVILWLIRIFEFFNNCGYLITIDAKILLNELATNVDN